MILNFYVFFSVSYNNVESLVLQRNDRKQTIRKKLLSSSLTSYSRLHKSNVHDIKLVRHCSWTSDTTLIWYLTNDNRTFRSHVRNVQRTTRPYIDVSFQGTKRLGNETSRSSKKYFNCGNTSYYVSNCTQFPSIHCSTILRTLRVLSVEWFSGWLIGRSAAKPVDQFEWHYIQPTSVRNTKSCSVRSFSVQTAQFSISAIYQPCTQAGAVADITCGRTVGCSTGWIVDTVYRCVLIRASLDQFYVCVPFIWMSHWCLDFTLTASVCNRIFYL